MERRKVEIMPVVVLRATRVRHLRHASRSFPLREAVISFFFLPFFNKNRTCDTGLSSSHYCPKWRTSSSVYPFIYSWNFIATNEYCNEIFKFVNYVSGTFFMLYFRRFLSLSTAQRRIAGYVFDKICKLPSGFGCYLFECEVRVWLFPSSGLRPKWESHKTVSTCFA